MTANEVNCISYDRIQGTIYTAAKSGKYEVYIEGYTTAIDVQKLHEQGYSITKYSGGITISW